MATNQPPASTSQPSSSSSLFLALPTELRLQIYTYLFCPPSLSIMRQLSARNHCSDYVLPALHLTPSLLQTNHQINSEATPILYAANTFAAHPNLLTDMPFLVTRSRPVTHGRGKSMISRWKVTIRLDTDPGFDREKVARCFVGAEEVVVEVWQAMFGSCDLAVLRLFESVRGVGRARITGSVGDGLYASWLERAMMTSIGEEVEEFDDEGQDEEVGKGTGRGRNYMEWNAWMGNR